MSTKHDIHLENTRIGHAVREMTEDGLAAMRHHYEDTIVEDQGSTITIKIKIMPDKRRQKFDWTATTTHAFAPRRSSDGTFYAAINSSDQVVLKEYNPEQMDISEDFAH